MGAGRRLPFRRRRRVSSAGAGTRRGARGLARLKPGLREGAVQPGRCGAKRNRGPRMGPRQRGHGRRLVALAGRGLLAEAVAAVYRLVTARDERDLGFLAAVGADGRMHLPPPAVSAAATAAVSAAAL